MMASRALERIALACLAWAAASADAAPGVADYQRSLGLREAWSGLTRDVAFPAQWRSDGHFYYRRTVEGGFDFVLGRPDSTALQPAFDAARLAQGLAAASHQAQSALKLPFSQFDYAAEGAEANAAIRFYMDSDYSAWRCTLTDYVCAPVNRPGGRAGSAWCVTCGCRPTTRRGARRTAGGRLMPTASTWRCVGWPTAR
jgi:hypothetical protein